MASKTPILKRCKNLDISPAVVGINKESNRQVKRSNKKVSEYGLQLKEKQKAKFIYDVMETPFHNYYVKAEKMKGQAGDRKVFRAAERLDTVIDVCGDFLGSDGIFFNTVNAGHNGVPPCCFYLKRLDYRRVLHYNQICILI